MERVDRLGWAAGQSFFAFGLKIGIRVSEAEWLDQAGACLPEAARPVAATVVDRLYSLKVASGGPRRRGVRHYHCLYANDHLAARALDGDRLFASLRADVERYVAEHARDRIFVHAGAVACLGQGLILPGVSGSGKSTLVRALVAAGATMLSDEFAVLDRRGRVHAYQRPTESAAAIGSQEPVSVGLVAVLRYRAGARWSPRRLPRSRLVLEMLANTIPARSFPERALTSIAAAVQSAAGVKGTRGEAQPAATALLELLQRESGSKVVADS